MDLEKDLPDEWWCKIQKWMDGHWRILALALATLIFAIVAIVIVNRLNQTDERLKRAVCAEIVFLETSGRPRAVKLAANLRLEITCPP